ncbi:MAG: OmpA family protein [Bacteroidales bacterium]|nr:OmpA family protein [Bacteroidales bacterium]
MRMMRNFVLLMLCLSLIVPPGCQSFQNMNKTGQNAVVGGAAGGAVGAGIGALLGGGKGTWIGALIGSAIGAGAGAAIGNQMDRQKNELERELAQVKELASQKDTTVIIKTIKDSNDLKAIKIVLGDAILFNTGSSTLSPLAESALSRIAYNLSKNPNTIMTIVGYTDNTGSYETNMRLSQQRADAVRNYLISQGISSSRLQAIGKGWNDPIASNATPAGRAQNRRVEMYITAGEQMIKDAQQAY